jgi:hypothetical protein
VPNRPPVRLHRNGIQTRYDPKADALHVKFGPDGANYLGADEVAAPRLHRIPSGRQRKRR